MAGNEAFQARVDQVLARVDIASVIGKAIKLGRGKSPRGRCPFHGSESDSFSVATAPRQGGTPFAHCFGCSWNGNVIRFVADYYNLSFAQALERLEDDHGLDGAAASPVHRERAPTPRRRREERPMVDTATMGRFIWEAADSGPRAWEKLRIYLIGRGVPPAMLADDRLADIRFLALGPIVPWREDAKPSSVPQAPIMAARIRKPVLDQGRVAGFEPIGLHLTFLAPNLGSKMKRRRRDGSLYPDRKMLGSSKGGCVLLGRYDPFCPLYPGEGLETVLSGMGLNDAPAAACGLAVLSLDNLQGEPIRWRNGALPLFDIRPDPEKPPVCFRHDGLVTGLIDADMKPLRGPIDRETGKPRGLPVVEARGGPVIFRTITTAERTTICADLFVKSWRRAGCRRVAAQRPRMGQDFNDAARELAAA